MKRVLGYGLVLLAAAGAGPYFAGAAGAGSGPAAAHGAQGYLGVALRDVTADQVGVLKLKDARGAEIVLVDHDAPAGKVGLREHDVILKMNGQAIDGESQIHRMLHETPAGKTIVLLISRDGQLITVSAQMANQGEVERRAWEQHITVPEPQAPPATAAEDESGGFSSGASSPSPSVHAGNSFIGTILMSPAYTGVTLEPLSTQLAQFFGATDGRGLLVRSVVANSPGARSGMQAGDVVVQADAKPVASPADWSKAVKNSHGRPLDVVVLRDKKQQTLTLTPDGKKRSSVEPPDDGSDSASIGHLEFSWMPRS